ncbi:MAG: hypothetical protein ACLQVD_20400 [Capsulimonadaceae bacterium]
MSDEQMVELIGLAIDDSLPAALRGFVEQTLASDPRLAEDARTLHAVSEALASLPSPHPDPWFVERALFGLLREHDAGRTDTVLQSV